jgi:LPS export ABC transporter protein LptC
LKRLVLLVVLLAGCKRSGIVPPVGTVADSSLPDQTVYAMRTYLVRNGARASLVEADTAYINQQMNSADLVGLRITFFDSLTGRTTSVVTSRTGKYDIRNQSLDARGNVVAVTADVNPKTLKTEHLVYDKIQDRIHSDTAFTVTGVTEHMSGNAFEADPSFKVVTVVRPRAKEKLAPPKRSTTKGKGSK